jgi:SAM-dependent methyltransferase
MRAAPARPGSEVVWHDVECGGYGADLPLWERLAADSGGGGLLDLGAGTGRVALHLAACGHSVTAVDHDPRLLAALAGRAAERGLALTTEQADIRELALGRRYALIIAPMQLAHLLGGAAGRTRALHAIRRHLSPGGRFYAALLDDSRPLSSGTPNPLPDVREIGGWVHSSLPLEVRPSPGGVEIERLRELVSARGERREQRVSVHLDELTIDRFEREARAAGLLVLPRLAVAETTDHVGSVLACLGSPE